MKRLIFLILFVTSLYSQDNLYYYYYTNQGGLPRQCTTLDTFHVSVGSYLPLSHTTNLSIKEGINVGQQYKIRQNGTLYGVTLYCASTATVTSVQIRVWRKSGSTYNRIGTSENFYSRLSAGANNTIYFTQPITGCLEGDYYSLVYNTAASPFQGVADANCTLYYISGASDSLAYAWASQSSVAYGIPATLYMLNPNLVFIGDSQISCATSNLETTLATTYSTSLPYLVGTAMGYTWQNMGLGGNSSTQVLARFQADMSDLHPTAGIVLVNVNDIAGGVSSNTIVSNNQTMVETMAGNRIRPYFIENLPWSNGTNAQQRQFDSVRSRVRTIVLANGGYVISTVSTFGVASDSGDANNKWWLNPTYTSDGVHLNSAGNVILQGLITSALTSNGCPSYTTTAIIPIDTVNMNQYWTDENALGTITTWTSLKDTNVFRQSTSAYKPTKQGSVLFDTTDKVSANIKTQSTAVSLEFIMKVTDTNSYANQFIAGIRYATPTLTVLSFSIFKNSSASASKFITSYYAGGGYYDKDYSTTALLNKFVHVVITADSTNRVKVYFNGTLQTVVLTSINNSFNGTGTVQLGESTNGMKNIYIRRFITWRTALSQSDITSHYNTFNGLGLIDP